MHQRCDICKQCFKTFWIPAPCNMSANSIHSCNLRLEIVSIYRDSSRECCYLLYALLG